LADGEREVQGEVIEFGSLRDGEFIPKSLESVVILTGKNN